MRVLIDFCDDGAAALPLPAAIRKTINRFRATAQFDLPTQICRLTFLIILRASKMPTAEESSFIRTVVCMIHKDYLFSPYRQNWAFCDTLRHHTLTAPPPQHPRFFKKCILLMDKYSSQILNFSCRSRAIAKHETKSYSRQVKAKMMSK